MRAARSARGVRAGAVAGVVAGGGAEEPPLNPSHFSLQSTQDFGVP